MSIAMKKLAAIGNERFFDVYQDASMVTHAKGKTFYVDSNTGNASYSGERITAPLATIAQAVAKCTASQGDRIIVLPQHSETITSTIVPVAGSAIIGLRIGNRRPIISVNGAVDLISFDNANATVTGLEFAIVTTDAATAFINFNAAKCLAYDCHAADCSAGSNVNVVDVVTVTASATSSRLDSCRFRNTTTAVNSFLSLEGAVANFTAQDNIFFGDVATAGIIDAATATQLFLLRNNVAVVGTTKPAATLDSNPTGLAAYNLFSGTHATLATNANLGSAIRAFENYVLEETDGSKQGALIPAADVD